MKKNSKLISFGFFLIIIFIAIFLNLYKRSSLPPCLNADEASFGYNAYSILKTGRDEHGALLPLRLRSFEDYKMPLYAYASIPFIFVFGLNENSIRALNFLSVMLIIFFSYFVAIRLYGKKYYGLISMFLFSTSLWLIMLARHAHEAVFSSALLIVSLYSFLVYSSNNKMRWLIYGIFLSFLSSFAYHFGRIFLVFFVIYALYLVLYKPYIKSPQFSLIVFKKFFTFECRKNISFFLLCFIFLATPFIVDRIYGVNRLSSLFFLRDPGIYMRIKEYRAEHNLAFLHNIFVEGVRDVSARYFSLFSTDFFLTKGDANPRFGYKGIGLLTPIEYIFFLIGLYFIFSKKLKYRFLLLSLLLISPLPNAFVWQDVSVTRTYFFIIPFLLVVSFGVGKFFEIFFYYKKTKNIFYFSILFLFIFIHMFFLITNWDLYIYHYPSRALVIRSWQCGYKELASFVKENPEKIFYITRKHGQPYIFLLFYLKIPPQQFWKNAVYTLPDEYGFSQVEKFGRFVFSANPPQELKNIFIVGYPDDFPEIEADKVYKKIKFGKEDIFWVVKRE